MREVREKPSSLPSGGGCSGGEQQAHLSLHRRGHAGKASATPPKASGESGEWRPTSPHQLVQGCGGCRLCRWEGEWEEAAKAAGG